VSDPGAALFGTSAETLKAYYLSSIDVFRDLARSEVERLAQTTRMITCPRGRTIYRAGEANEALFLLKTGRVQIARDSGDGKRLISAVLGPHTFFGEMALVGQRFPQDSTAEAIEDALICVLSRKDLERLILQHPKVGLRFLEQLSARLLETEAVVHDFAFKGVPARLAGALLRLADTAADGTIRASHQELADMIGAYRETATLTLDEFRKRGLVELGRRSIELLDRRALEQLAEP
jgi:CRP-like cAMP-binding protein